ncbi:hypothetical protein GGX14DRAFT_396045 [Mycena pura]|uniref:Uncharacterized protein n=1 Tax=Mycena pura TaxID=153505 RepID=A0AAD6YBQ0_9AGAR|nr:hypothetical protein GGX14DRAFT_396045 [Mycena pura]
MACCPLPTCHLPVLALSPAAGPGLSVEKNTSNPLLKIRSSRSPEPGIGSLLRVTLTVKVLYIHMRKPKYSRRLPGRLVGLVRVTLREPPATVSPSTVDPTVPSSPLSAVTPSNWDGWPDGAFQCQLFPQNVADTNQLELHWVCENIPGHRGSRNALTWQKVVRHALRGSKLHLRSAALIFTDSVRRRVHAEKICASTPAESKPRLTSTAVASDTPSGSDTDSEWQGIQQEDGTEQAEDLFPNSEFDGLSQHDGVVFVFTIFARISIDHE